MEATHQERRVHPRGLAQAHRTGLFGGHRLPGCSQLLGEPEGTIKSRKRAGLEPNAPVPYSFRGPRRRPAVMHRRQLRTASRRLHTRRLPIPPRKPLSAPTASHNCPPCRAKLAAHLEVAHVVGNLGGERAEELSATGSGPRSPRRHGWTACWSPQARRLKSSSIVAASSTALRCHQRHQNTYSGPEPVASPAPNLCRRLPRPD